MAGFADLVTQAQPALLGQGCAGSASAGRTWSWRFTDILDNAGDPIDLSAVTADCEIVTAAGGGTILALDFDGGTGEFTISADETDTDGLFVDGDNSRGRICAWYLTITNGTDSVQVWMVDNSPFSIRRGA